MQKLRTLSQSESALAKKFGEGAGFSRWQTVADIMKNHSELPATAARFTSQQKRSSMRVWEV
jgi:hypothetical protein